MLLYAQSLMTGSIRLEFGHGLAFTPAGSGIVCWPWVMYVDCCMSELQGIGSFTID